VPGDVIVARTLDRELRFHCPDDATARALAYVAAAPRMPPPGAPPLDVEIVPAAGRFYDFAPPQPSAPGTPAHLVERAHQLLRDVLVEETAADPIIHGGSLVTGGRRILVIADKGVGKTTFMLHALADGIAVETDEHVVVRSGDLLARPRSLHVKASSVPLAPAELQPAILASPTIRDWYGNPIHSFVPETAGRPWRIAPGQADHLIFMEANHGGLTGLGRLGREAAFQRLLDNVFLPPAAARGGALARLHRLVAETPCWAMRVGGLSRALWHLRQLACLL
jgi:hypothetical protein